MTNEVKTPLTAQEVWVAFASLRYKKFPSQNDWGELRTFDKTEELTSLETFRELKKGISDKWLLQDCELVLWSLQKEMIIKCVNEFSWTLDEIEHKISLISKLQDEWDNKISD